MSTAVVKETAAAPTEERSQFRAFVQDDETRATVDQVLSDLMIPQASLHKGGIAQAVDMLGEVRSPRLLVVDISGIELPLSAINDLAEVCEPGVTVIAIGDRNDVGLFRDLINRGISDYLVKPVTPALLQRSLLAAAEGASAPRQTSRLGRLVAVVGTRGGVGATMFAANCAWDIANQRRRRVAVVDLDLQFGSVGLALDLEPSQGLREALENPSRIDGLYLERAMVKQSETLFVLSAEEPLDEAVMPDPAAVDLLLKELRNRFHYVVVDLPRTVSPSWQYVLQSISNLIVVTDLSLAGMRDTLRVMSLMPASNASCQVTIVANRVGEHRQGEISRAEFEKGIGRAVDVLVPFDGKAVAAAVNVGQPIATLKSPAAKAIATIGDQLCGAPQKARPALWRRWLGRRS
ncbi:MAG TPA: AAA family ATPase [Geminicoccaceae bacterium]|nr:AAA family ATPase [Geminicoccus sp.]HMU50033.1 AAA family ATPase [Geminicoccaceae bacterium]